VALLLLTDGAPRTYAESGTWAPTGRFGPTVLELYPARAAATAVRLGFAITDVTAAVEAVRSVGRRVEREPTTAEGSALVRDPDDNPVELTPS
jgi:hypothetical protein